LSLSNQFKPAILQCFGDIAQAIGGAFELYLPVVAQVLEQAASVVIDTSQSYEMLDYIISLREGIMDAWAGAIIAMKAGNKGSFDPPSSFSSCSFAMTVTALKPYVDAIFKLLQLVSLDQNRSEALLRSAMGVIGYEPKKSLSVS